MATFLDIYLQYEWLCFVDFSSDNIVFVVRLYVELSE